MDEATTSGASVAEPSTQERLERALAILERLDAARERYLPILERYLPMLERVGNNPAAQFAAKHVRHKEKPWT